MLCLSLLPCWYVFPLTTGSKLAFFLQDQSVTKPADLLIQPSVFLCIFTALRSVLIRQIGIHILFFSIGGGGGLRFGLSIAAKDSHFANAVFAPKAVLQQNATGGDLRCCPFLL